MTPNQYIEEIIRRLVLPNATKKGYGRIWRRIFKAPLIKGKL